MEDLATEIVNLQVRYRGERFLQNVSVGGIRSASSVPGHKDLERNLCEFHITTYLFGLPTILTGSSSLVQIGFCLGVTLRASVGKTGTSE